MTKLSKNLTIISIVIFCILETIIGLIIQLGDSAHRNVWCYISVVMAFLFALSTYRRDKTWLYTTLALMLTLVADYFLVLRVPQHQLLGVIAFVFVQLTYAIRLYYMQPATQRKLHLILRSALTILAIIIPALVLGEGVDLLSVVSVIYYANLLLNIVYALVLRDWIYAIGMILFCGCDTVIGLRAIAGGYLPIDNSILLSIIYPGFDLVWAFYVPSQALIALSLVKGRLKNS